MRSDVASTVTAAAAAAPSAGDVVGTASATPAAATEVVRAATPAAATPVVEAATPVVQAPASSLSNVAPALPATVEQTNRAVEQTTQTITRTVATVAETVEQAAAPVTTTVDRTREAALDDVGAAASGVSRPPTIAQSDAPPASTTTGTPSAPMPVGEAAPGTLDATMPPPAAHASGAHGASPGLHEAPIASGRLGPSGEVAASVDDPTAHVLPVVVLPPTVAFTPTDEPRAGSRPPASDTGAGATGRRPPAPPSPPGELTSALAGPGGQALVLLALFSISSLALAAPALGRRLRPGPDLLRPPALVFSLERPG